MIFKNSLHSLKKSIMLYYIRKLIPKKLFVRLAPWYHYTMALISALVYFFPSRKIFVIAVTGTKGKTSTVELISAMLEEEGYTTALSSTVRFKIANRSRDNQLKMTMPGRFFMQRFLRHAVGANCDYVIIEMTSEGVKQYRHKFISLNALIFTNLTPEHIESHGSYEKYREVKLQIAKALERSSKKRKLLVVNSDDKAASHFLKISLDEKYRYRLSDAKPYTLKKEGLSFTYGGIKMTSFLSGAFNLYNILAAITFVENVGVGKETILSALQKFRGIPGRVEKIDVGQDFTVIVDYAHTPDSLEKVYEVFQGTKKICVLGGTGGGRDRRKRKIMGGIANKHCSRIFLTDEDPYDEDPKKIVDDIKKGIERPIVTTIMDRREAIRAALKSAETGDTVLVTGKGTDPYIMGPSGTKLKWSDAEVVREELSSLLGG